MEALLIKNDEWDFVSGASVKPEPIAENAANATAISAWTKGDSKAKSDIILSISGAETSQRVQHIARGLVKIRVDLPVERASTKGHTS